jgi:hypothetical protein
MKSLYRKGANYKMPGYLASREEVEACLYCIRNNIRIAPQGIQNDSDHWKITITLGPYKKGERPNVAPSIYDRHAIWKAYYEFCKYYYDKHRK